MGAAPGRERDAADWMTGASELDPASSPPRRIAFVITVSEPGGAQAHVLSLAQALAEAGHVPGVFVGGDGALVDQCRDAGIAVWPIPDLIRDVRPRRDARALARLRVALTAFNPDLVSCHSSKGGWYGRSLAWWIGVPSVLTAHGWLLTPDRPTPWQQVVRGLEWATGKLAEHVIVVSHYDRAIPLQYGILPAGKITVVHNAVPEVGPELIAEPQRTPPTVTTVARLDWPKTPDVILEALVQLRSLPWRFEIIGDGSQRPALQRRAVDAGVEDRIDFMGMRDDVPQRLAQAQVFVLSSTREGFPISILEAMRAGVPVVASDVGGIREAVLRGQNGELVPSGSVPAMTDALRPLLEDPSLRLRQGGRGREIYETSFSMARHVRKTWAVFDRAMNTFAAKR